MATLVEAAQRMMDLFEQNYQANDKFLDLDDWKYQIATAYSTALSTMYQSERRANKQMDGFSNIEIPAAWLVSEEITIEYDEDDDRYYSNLKHPVFSFDWDNAANALQGVHKRGKGPHCVYRKISLNERRFRQIIPPNSAILFYLNKPTEIVFWGAKKGANVEVQYVPAIVGQENDCILSDNIISVIQDKILETFFKSKTGNFIQKADDQNPNTPVPQGDPAINK